MRKKIITILIVVTIIYIIVSGLLFLNIQFMESPEIIVEIEITELNSEVAILHTVVNIDNPNGFDMITKDLKFVTTTPDGYEIANVIIKGGKIDSNSKKTFTKDIQIALNGRSPKQLITKMTGEVGANILFIEKTIPLNFGVVTSIEKLLDGITTPSLSISIDFEDMTTDGIDLSANISVYNPNSFEIFVKDIEGELVADTGKKVGNIDILGDVPDLEELLLSKDSPAYLSIYLDEKFTLRGIVFDIGLEINNSYKIDLLIKDIRVAIYTVADDANRLIGERENIGDLLALSGSSGYSSCEILVPYLKILPTGIFADWMMASVSGKVTISGVNQSVFIEIRGYHSLHPIR
jgi:LEA14-like dessication related protein